MPDSGQIVRRQKGYKGRQAAQLFETKKLGRPRPACRHDELNTHDLKLRRCLGHCGRTILTDRYHRICADCTRHNASNPPPPAMERGLESHHREHGLRT